jgi:hypothetical protein
VKHKNCDLFIRDFDKKTALMWTVINKRKDCEKILVAACEKEIFIYIFISKLEKRTDGSIFTHFLTSQIFDVNLLGLIGNFLFHKTLSTKLTKTLSTKLTKTLSEKLTKKH